MAFWSVILVSLFLSFSIRLISVFWNWSTLGTIPTSQLIHALLSGLRFDAFAITWVALLPMVLALILGFFVKNPKRWMIILVGVFQLVGLWLNVADIEMVRIAGRRFEFWDKFLLEESGSVFAGLGLEYLALFLIGAAAWVLLFYLSFWLLKRMPQFHGWKRAASVLVSIALLVLAARGGLQTKPLDYAHANMFQSVPLNTLTMNSVFTVIRSAKKVRIPDDHFMPAEEAEAYLDGARSKPSVLDGHRPTQPQNVVILIVESLSLEHMGLPFGGDGFTPNLDALAKKSLFFTRGIANARRSIDGVCAVLAGIPAWADESFISSPSMNSDFGGLANLIKDKGYHSAFFHGGNNGTMYFDSFAARAGFDDYYGAREFPDQRQHDGTWGIFDEPFMKYAVEMMNGFKTPFLVGMFSLSSHNPYVIPKEYKGRFPKGTLHIHESIGYTDFAIGQFFAAAEKQKWYDNTLFIVTADHAFYEVRHPEYSNEIGISRIPILFFHPKGLLPKVDTDQIVQQIDILPSVLDYLGLLEQKHILLGQSVFSVGGERSALFASGGSDYWFLRGDHYMHYRRGGPYHLFAWQDPSQQHVLLDQPERVSDFKRRTEAYLQSYSQALLKGQLLASPKTAFSKSANREVRALSR